MWIKWQECGRFPIISTSDEIIKRLQNSLQALKQNRGNKMKKKQLIRKVSAQVLTKSVEYLTVHTGIDGDSIMSHGLESTPRVQYRVTFGTQDGRILNMVVPLALFLSVEEGTKGILRHSGRFRSFQSNQEMLPRETQSFG